MRRLIAVTILAAGLAAPAVVAVAAAHSAARPLTWDAAARRAKFPVYRPRVTLGLKPSGLLFHDGCLLAGWGTRTGPHFGIYEPGDSVQCGQPGEATAVAKTIINGVKVHVLVQCPTIPRCTIRDGEKKGELLLFVPEPRSKRYFIQLQSTHVSLAHFLRIAKSFRRVR